MILIFFLALGLGLVFSDGRKFKILIGKKVILLGRNYHSLFLYIK